ncbi:YczE/YyaS/YitT family protein [Gottschalkia acidurici]|nr:hypothetical protein [Gottschalkia acidurici]
MIKRYMYLFSGLFLCALGMVMTINAELGYAPWDVFHKGLSNIFHTTIGTSNIITGIVILLVQVIFGEKPGIGTLCNMILIGVFMNIIMSSGLIPVFNSFTPSLIMMIIGMIILGIGTYFYIASQLGAGPRDSLMIMFIKKTNKSVRFVKNSMEITILIIGYLLGGPVGIGTLIMSVGMGYILQFIFKIFKFDTREVRHRLIDEDIRALKNIVFNSRKKANS